MDRREELTNFVSEFIELSKKYRCTVDSMFGLTLIDFDGEIQHGLDQEKVDENMENLENILTDQVEEIVNDEVNYKDIENPNFFN